MAYSAYKGERSGKTPVCLLCPGPGMGPRTRVNLGHSVHVWLCAEHAGEEFRRRRAGRDLVASLQRAWTAAGCLTASRRRALERLQVAIGGPQRPDGLPGSYAWPGLRAEAERRANEGETARSIIATLRGRLRGDTAKPPSERTIRRWIAERRPLHLPTAPTPPTPPTPRSNATRGTVAVPDRRPRPHRQDTPPPRPSPPVANNPGANAPDPVRRATEPPGQGGRSP